MINPPNRAMHVMPSSQNLPSPQNTPSSATVNPNAPPWVRPIANPPQLLKMPDQLPLPSNRPNSRIKRPPSFHPKGRWEPKLPPYSAEELRGVGPEMHKPPPVKPR